PKACAFIASPMPNNPKVALTKKRLRVDIECPPPEKGDPFRPVGYDLTSPISGEQGYLDKIGKSPGSLLVPYSVRYLQQRVYRTPLTIIEDRYPAPFLPFPPAQCWNFSWQII